MAGAEDDRRRFRLRGKSVTMCADRLGARCTVMVDANDLARLAIRTCDGQSLLKSLLLERIYRDSRCGSLMLPLTAKLSLDRLGREALYEAGEED